MAPFDTVLITNTLSRVSRRSIKNRSTPASAAAIPSWPAPFPRSGGGLICWMRMRRKQLRTPDHFLLPVIVEPILTRLEAGYDRMPRCRRMLGCMLTRRTVTASDVPTLRTAAEMKPPTFR